MLRRRRAAQINRQSIPYGSIKVEYLESPIGGKTVINTNIFPSENVCIDTTAAVATDSQGVEAFILGSNSYSNRVEKGIIIVAKLNSSFHQKIWFGNNYYEFNKHDDLEKHNYIFQNKKLTVDGELIKDFSDVNDFTSVAPLFLFAQGNRYYLNSSGLDGFDGGQNTKIFDYKMTCGDKKINLLPSIDITGTPCMFDLISRKNFYNYGTSQFKYVLPNNMPNGLPSDYTSVEYLESDDKCGISTNYYPTNNTVVEAEVNVLNNKIYGRVFGTYGGGQRGSYTLYFNGGNMAADFYSRYTKNNSCQLNKKTHIHFGQDGIILDGNLIITPDKISSWTSSIKLDIWSCGADETIEQKNSGNVRVYWFKIFENGQIVRNFIPAIDPNGTPCLYDLVFQKPYYNNGLGQFTYPTTSTTYSLRRPQVEWAKMTDTGVHKIYHTPIGYNGSLEDYAIENGYKQLIETESPNEEGKYYSFKWVETDDTLTTEWYEIDPHYEEFIEENLDNLTE